MTFLFFVSSGIFIIFLRRIYFDSVFSMREKPANLLFLISSVFACILLNILSILLAGNHSLFKMIVTLLSNFAVNYLLSLFYVSKNIGYRIAMVFSFQTIMVLSESITGGLLIKAVSGAQYMNEQMLDSVISIFSSILSFLLIIIFSMIWKNKNKKIDFSQLLVSGITPLGSLLFIIFLPYQSIANLEKNNHVFFTFIILLILNFLNYFSLNNLLRRKELQEKVQNQEKQISFQTDKFNQLSNAYKSSKRITHEIKHRDQYLISCIQNKEYEKAEDELKKGISFHDTLFVDSTTHNLVIDTFISSYTSLAKEEGIHFQTEISTTKDSIPLSDYDLCILLGNLLDNCFHAADAWKDTCGSYEGFKIDCRIFSQDKFFTVHMKNPSLISFKKTPTTDSLSHGFGIINIKKIVKQHHGFYHQTDDGVIYATTISIPINNDKTPTPPRKYAENIGPERFPGHFIFHVWKE